MIMPLTPTAMPEQVQQWCDEADRFQFAAVLCISCLCVKQLELLRGKQPKVCTVIGFSEQQHSEAMRLRCRKMEQH